MTYITQCKFNSLGSVASVVSFVVIQQLLILPSTMFDEKHRGFEAMTREQKG